MGELQGSGFSDSNQAAAETHYEACLRNVVRISVEAIIRSGPGSAADHAARVRLVERGMDLVTAQLLDAHEIDEHFRGHEVQFEASA